MNTKYFISRRDGPVRSIGNDRVFRSEREARLYLQGRRFWDDNEYKIIEVSIDACRSRSSNATNAMSSRKGSFL